MSNVIVTHVKPGETLSGIAVRYGVSVDALQRWNRIEDPDLVLIGQRIIVYNAPDAAGPSLSGSAVARTTPGSPMADGSWGVVVGAAVALGLVLLLLLFRRKRDDATPTSRAPSPRRPQPVSLRGAPVAKGQDSTLRNHGLPSAADSLSKRQVNHGERLVSAELRRRYRDWILIDDIMLPSGRGTTQIDHILVSPGAVFLIETKDMNGWVFGRPGDKRWTQSYAAGPRLRKAGIRSRQFQFYNPLRQNESHARALVRLGMVARRRLRPIVIFVGDSRMKTACEFLPFDEHEKIARRNSTYRMRGVVCTSLAELHRYIDFSIKASSNPGWTRQQMETICGRLRAEAIPVTAESHAKHVDFVHSLTKLHLR